MLSKLKGVNPARILALGYLLGFPALMVLSRIMLSRPGATAESVANWLIPMKCPVKWLTGFLCPTCGLGRSILLSLNGQISQALEFHLLGPLVATFMGLAFLYLLIPKLYKEKVLKWQLPKHFKPRPALYTTLLLAYCLWGFARNF